MTATTADDARQSRLVGLRLAARLARREIIRRPGRTVLVALLVALPVAGMSVAAVAIRTGHETALQLYQQNYGHSDASANLTEPIGPRSPVLRFLPKSRIVNGRVDVESRLLQTSTEHLSIVGISFMDLRDPITRGIVQITSGRAPTAANQVFLTRTAAHQLGVRAGDALRLVRPARRSLLVTGVGEWAAGWGQTSMVFPPGVPYPWKADVGGPQAVARLIAFDRPPTARELRVLASPAAARAGINVSPAYLTRVPDAGARSTENRVRWSWLFGALVLTVVGIVIAAAFASGARRQLVTLGQLAGNGADPQTLRRVLFLQGTFAGVVGAAGGLGLGAIALALLAPHADRILQRDVHPYSVRASDIVPIVVLGVVAATIAALIPAYSAGRVPVLAALSGRRPLGKVPRWLPIAGTCAIAAGLAVLALAVIGASGRAGHEQVWVLTAIAGSVSVLLGACAFAPFYVSVLEPAARRTRGSWRVATRSLARQRTRTSAVVSALAATGALVIAVSSLLLAVHTGNDVVGRTMRSDEVQLSGSGRDSGPARPSASFVAAVQHALPHSTRYQIQVAYRPDAGAVVTYFPNDPAAASGRFEGDPNLIGVADRSLISDYGLRAQDQHALATHGALVLGPAAGRAEVQFEPQPAAPAGAPAPPKVDAPMVDTRRYLIGSLPHMLVTPATAQRLGLTVRPSTVVIRTPKALSAEQRARIEDVALVAQDALHSQDVFPFNYEYYTPPTGIDPLLVEWLLLGVALVFTLFVVAVNLALSATETRDERDVLTVVGADPAAMGRANGYKAALLTFMGSLLAIPVGLLPVAVFFAVGGRQNHLEQHFVFPTRVVVLLLVALPIAAGLVTAVASAVSLRLRPVRISTLAFD